METVARQFDEEGYVILRGLLGAEVVAGVKAELERWVDECAGQLLEEGLVDDLHADEPFATRLIRLYADCLDRVPGTLRRELHWPGMYDLFFYPPLLDLVEGLLGSEIRLYPNYSVRPKLPEHAPTEVLWHQDAGYTASGMHGRDEAGGELSVEALRMVNVWTPLVAARRENGCMQFVPGTHKIGLAQHEKRRYYLEIAQADLEPHLERAIDITCDPGDIVVFSNLLFHRGLPNHSQAVRWSCDWRYQDARQSTMRGEKGHLARSQAQPKQEVHSAQDWASRSFI
jgi:ectoine hydroxylase-related dioxygenase (phytanoyl-CoA dioxygenase family)